MRTDARIITVSAIVVLAALWLDVRQQWVATNQALAKIQLDVRVTNQPVRVVQSGLPDPRLFK